MKVYTYVLAALPLLGWGDAQPNFQAEEPSSDLPWLTGTLLTPAENTVPYQRWNIQPYFTFNAQYGQYDPKWDVHELLNNQYAIQSTTYIEYGIAPRLDLQVIPQFAWQATAGASDWVLGDVGLILDLQLLYSKKGHYWPNLKLLLAAEIPLGRYERLNPQKRGMDIGGGGSFDPTVGLAAGEVFQLSPIHFIRVRTFTGYTVPNSVTVHGLNVYGGGEGTSGVVYPGAQLIGILGVEYTMTINWVLACDLAYVHQNKQHFKGKTLYPMQAPSSEQFSLAPALEYNWNDSIGLISGVWFSAAGRNSAAFAEWMTSMNFYF